MRKFTIATIFILLYSTTAFTATFGVSGLLHFPYALSTQKSDDGGNNILTWHPGVSFNAILPFFGNHIISPEMGYVYYRDNKDDYSKSSIFLLCDLGYRFSANTLLRYGVGTFITSISGDGAAIVLNNGSGTATFYRPTDTTKSYTSTFNLGIESIYTPQLAWRLETFIANIFSSERRKLSYTLQIIKYF